MIDFKTLSCSEMCIMGNGNDLPAYISSSKFPDENTNSMNSGLIYGNFMPWFSFLSCECTDLAHCQGVIVSSKGDN